MQQSRSGCWGMPGACWAHTSWTGTWMPVNKPACSVCIWKGNTPCSLPKLAPGGCASCSHVLGKNPVAKVSPRSLLTPTHISVESPSPESSVGTEPKGAQASSQALLSATCDAGSVVLTFSHQAVSWCLPYPQLGAPSLSACQPHRLCIPLHPRPSVSRTSFDISLLHLVNKVPFYLLLTWG